MKFEELTDFAKSEHDRLVKHYAVKGDPKTKYTMFAKLVEEVGELSQSILMTDSMQRAKKLNQHDKTKSKEELEDELADVILVASILAQELDVDLAKAIKTKIKKIKERKY
jgi:NTP pyrophosphatase (non-canonical NTP hydrolase)